MEDLLLCSDFLDDRRLARLFLGNERCKCEILQAFESEDGCTCGIGHFPFLVFGHGGVRKLDFDGQLAAMLLKMKSGEMDYVGFFGAL